jgi:magnesium transporter
MALKLANSELPFIDADARPYFRDVEDHIRRVLHRVADLRDILTSVIETSGLLEQQRQGMTTRRLAAWAAILAVPTAIAGVYGMNFDVMPELRWKFGYFAVLGLMTTVCLTLYVRFKRSGWL